MEPQHSFSMLNQERFNNMGTPVFPMSHFRAYDVIHTGNEGYYEYSEGGNADAEDDEYENREHELLYYN